MKYAIINSENIVKKIIEANQVFAEALALRQGCIAIPSSIAGVGAIYNPETGIITPKPDDAAFTAMQEALATEIFTLNQQYPSLNLLITDNISTTIPKLLNAGVTKAEVVYLNTLYQALANV